MASTKRPAKWWLYSDHARSASVRGACGSSIGISARRRRAERGQRGVKRVATSRERRAVRDDVDGGRQRGQRRGGEEHGEPESELDLDEASEPAQRQRRRRHPKPADGGEVERAEHEETGQDHDLGRDHHAVGGADQGREPVDVVQGEAHARGHQDGDRRQRQRPRSAADRPGAAMARAPAKATAVRCASPPIQAAAATWWSPSSAKQQPAVLQPRRGMAGQGARRRRAPRPAPAAAATIRADPWSRAERASADDDQPRHASDRARARLEVARRESRAASGQPRSCEGTGQQRRASRARAERDDRRERRRSARSRAPVPRARPGAGERGARRARRRSPAPARTGPGRGEGRRGTPATSATGAATRARRGAKIGVPVADGPETSAPVRTSTSTSTR